MLSTANLSSALHQNCGHLPTFKKNKMIPVPSLTDIFLNSRQKPILEVTVMDSGEGGNGDDEQAPSRTLPPAFPPSNRPYPDTLGNEAP